MQTNCWKHLRSGVILIALLYATPSHAQDVPIVELSAGYNFLRFQGVNSGYNLTKGTYGDVAFNLNRAVGIVGSLTWNHYANTPAISMMGGLRFSSRGFSRGPGRTIGFFHVLAGGFGFKEDNVVPVDRAVELGAGANVTVSDRAAIRLEADYIRTFLPEDSTRGDNYLRFSVGLSYGFGAR
jgi:hypothetical protein